MQPLKALFKKIWRAPIVQEGLGATLAAYIRLVGKTARITYEPADLYDQIDTNQPVIFAFWHGQHLLQTLLRRPADRCAVMISRHGDGQINAIAAQKLGMDVIRGSGAQRADQVNKRGGIKALLAMLTTLRAGMHVAMTADVPKIPRLAGEGIILLAKLSGRPILPLIVISAPRWVFNSWDRACLALPFGRTIIAIGTPLHVPADADPPALEAARLALEAALDQLYAHHYARLGVVDPGAGCADTLHARARHQAAKAADDRQAGNPPC